MLLEELGIEPEKRTKEWLAPAGSMGEIIWEEGYAKGYAEGFARGYAKGYAKGYAANYQKGFTEGFQKGCAKEMVANIRNLMASTGLSLNRAMDVLAVPTEDRERYAAAIEHAAEEPSGAKPKVQVQAQAQSQA